MRRLFQYTVLISALLGAGFLSAPFVVAAETLPPPPRDHFNDYAGLVQPATARLLDRELTQFERDTSNQLVVAIFPHMQSDSSIEDYTVRVAQSWGVGTREKKNGAVLFIFSQDRKLYIQVGYGLEGALPDALCKQIIANEITPRFRGGDFAGGVTAGVRAMIAATRGEYKGTGRTVADQRGGSSGDLGAGVIALVIILIILVSLIRAATRRNTVYSRRGRISPWIAATPWIGGSSGGWSSGGSSSGSSGSFSGGGGSFGGGGAGGSW